MEIIKMIVELVRAIPTIYNLWKKWELAKLRRIQEQEAAERQRAIEEGINSGDTESAEHAIGSGNAGKPAENQTGVRTRPVRTQP